jgi:RimJ/RimL family protein N-acetyltransferase
VATAALLTTGISRDEHLRFLKLAEERGEINWIAEKGGERIGFAGIYDLDHKNRRTEIGRFAGMAPDVHLLNVFVTAYAAFEVLNVNKICFHAPTRDVVSNKAIERFGAVKEAVLREETISDATFCDVSVYGLLASEWQTIKAGQVARLGQPEVIRSIEDEVG